MQSTKKKPNGQSLVYPAVLAFALSASILLLQLVQTRIYGVVFWNHLVYFIVSIALMGFGISGTWLSFGNETWLARKLTLRTAALLYVATTLVSSLLMPRLAPGIANLLESQAQQALLFATYFAAILPYFFAGWMLGGVFNNYVKSIHILYFSDLVGAASGCIVYLAGMQRYGAINLILVACALVAVPVLLVEGSSRSRVLFLAPTLVCLGIFSLFERSMTQAIHPDPSKAFNTAFSNLPEGAEKIVELTEWNTISRIDVVSSTDQPTRKIVFIDGDAFTGLVIGYPVPPPPVGPTDGRVGERSPYFFRNGAERVLVLGTGGGAQVYNALAMGAQHVDAVEINPTTWRLPLKEYRSEMLDLMHQPGVHSYREEGRSFVRRAGREYDVITIHGIDTFAALNAGAYMLAENYLYTVDAIEDYVRALSNDGLLVISRWYHYAETPRMFAVALEALYRLGVDDPPSRILVHQMPDGYAAMLIRAKPFQDREVAAFREHLAARNSPHPRLIYPRGADEPEFDEEKVIAAYADARRQGPEAARAYTATLDFQMAPVYDDSPFFFHFDKAGNMLDIFKSKNVQDFVRGNWPSFTLFSLLAFSVVVVASMMFVPLVRGGRPRVPGFGVWLLYFSSIGVSFIFIEIVLMQRFALLLGHPSRSLALVLASLLFFAGVGSYARSVFRVRLDVALAALLVLILVAAYAYPYIVLEVLPSSLFVRGAVTMALVAPLGFFMGMPFPSGLAGVSTCGAGVVPWMWGINGATTVLGSILAIVLAIYLNFTIVLLLAFLGYGVTLVSYFYLSRLGYTFSA